MSVIYSQSYIQDTFCQNGTCMSLNKLCNFKDNELQCLENYGIPSGLIIANITRTPIKKGKSKNIDTELFDTLYNSSSDKNKTRKQNREKKHNETKKQKKSQ